MRVLITGAAGFLGSHLTRALLDAGHEVLGVDNYYSGTRANITPLLRHRRFEMLRHDVTFPLYVEVDAIYHLACPASPLFYQRDPVHTTMTSVVGAVNMLGLAKRTGARILLTSTSEVYGDPQVSPQPETYWGHVNPVGLRSCYDEGKRCAEALFFDYHRQHGVSIKVARIFNTYGPRMRSDDGRVVSTFVTQALRGEPLSIFGDGSQTRSFCYVDDTISGLIRLMDSAVEVLGPMNIGNTDEITMFDLAHAVLRQVGGRIGEVRFQARPENDPQRRRPDIAQAMFHLDWSPQVDLDTGLRHTIRYFRKQLADDLHVQDPSGLADDLQPR